MSRVRVAARLSLVSTREASPTIGAVGAVMTGLIFDGAATDVAIVAVAIGFDGAAWLGRAAGTGGGVTTGNGSDPTRGAVEVAFTAEAAIGAGADALDAPVAIRTTSANWRSASLSTLGRTRAAVPIPARIRNAPVALPMVGLLTQYNQMSLVVASLY